MIFSFYYINVAILFHKYHQYINIENNNKDTLDENEKICIDCE